MVTVLHALAEPETVPLSGMLHIYAGKFVSCTNRNFFRYQANPLSRSTLAAELRKLVAAHFEVVDVFFSNYGPQAGPGIVVTLKESSLILGAWPERNSTIDFLFHYCGENHRAAVECAENLKEYFGARELTLSPITPAPVPLLRL